MASTVQAFSVSRQVARSDKFPQENVYGGDIMNTVSKLMLASAVSSMLAVGGAYADGTKIMTRSPEAAQADLVRDWNYQGGGTAVQVRERSKAEMQADLVRDWNGPSKASVDAEGKSYPQTRTAQQAYDDLVRNWN